MAITATGLGSGLDVESIISGLMAVERRPLSLISQQQSEIQSKISAIGKLSSALSDFKTSMSSLKSLSSFEIYTATSSDDTVFTASADTNAVSGSYTIDLSGAGQQLAQAHKVQSKAFTDATSSTTASGDLTIGLASGPSFTVAIDTNNDSLEGIRDAINNASDNVGVTATVINVDDGSHLIITADNSGTDSAMTLSGAVATTLSSSDVQTAKNAVFSIDGNTVTSQSNTVVDAIQGVTLNLKSLGSSSQTLTISNDNESVKESVQGFVDAYNKLSGAIKSLRAGELSGENVLLSIESQLRSVFNTTPVGLNTSLAYLSEIGITTTDSGDLTLSSSDLENQLNLDFNAVAELLADDDQGYVFRLEALADSLLKTDGLIDTRKDTLNSRSDALDDRRLNVEYRLELVEKRYRTQFAALDGLLSNLSATGNYLSQQLSSLPGSNK